MPSKKTATSKAADKSTTKKSTAAKSPAAAKKPSTAKAKESKAAAKANNVLEGFAKFAPYEPKKGEEYMSKGMEEHFNQILLAWKKELMEEVDRTVHHMQDDAANFPDPNDRATQESEFSMELRARDRERKLIKKIDESIRHLDNDEFGYCEACGVEIGVKRLEARPTATLCIDCKILDEIREKQMG